MIEHEPWIGCRYQAGINGQRIAIVGFSHYEKEGDEDTSKGTERCIRKIMSGCWRIPFFTNIIHYFAYRDHKEFWPYVTFFNFLPCVVGGTSDKYRHGTEEQRQIGRERMLRILGKELPHKTIVLTGRHWALPRFDRQSGMPGYGSTRFKICSYAIGNYHLPIFLLRHPQGAPAGLMRKAIEDILEYPAAENSLD